MTNSSTYDLKGNRTFRVLTVGSNSWRQWYDYDGAGRLWKVFSSTSGTKPASPDVTYTYRPSGAIDSRTFSPAAQKRYRYVMGTSAYDALNRLTSADFSPWSGSAWTSTTAHDLSNIGYDASGNLTSFRRYRETTSLIDNLTYTIPGSSNKLSSISEAAGSSSETWDAEAGSFTYDANGNILTTPAPYSITATTYDHRNQPISITRAGTTTTYRYNGGGWRIAKQVGSGNTEIYIQDGPVTFAVFTLNSSGTVTSWYFNILAGDKVVGRQPNTGSKSYYHTDLLGSTRAVVQGATVTESYDYDPYGMLMPGRTLAGATKEGFTGKERDSETGLDYFGQRLYMPAFGRWSTVDPVADSFPQWTPYNYVEGNPALSTDPFGLSSCELPTAECQRLATMLGTPQQVRPGIFAGAVLNALGQLGEWAAPKVVFVAAFFTPGPEEVALYALGKTARAGGRLAIGKIADLERHGLRPTMPNLGSPAANWHQNAALLRREMRRGKPVADVSTDPATGALLNNTGFLRAERRLLEQHGWLYDPKTRTWNPPQK